MTNYADWLSRQNGGAFGARVYDSDVALHAHHS